MLCHYADNSCDHKYCDSKDIMFLICRVTSCEPLFKGLCKFLAIGLVLVEI